MNFHENERPTDHGVVILDYGSQYTLLIARRLREIGAYSEVISPDAPPPVDLQISGIILSGGPQSVTAENSTQIPDWVKNGTIPILGICYGMQLLVENFGGKVRSGQMREYGKATIHLEKQNQPTASIFAGLSTNEQVWMSHGDDIESYSDDFHVLARSDQGVIAAISHKTKPYLGMQFHPEVHHTEHGKTMLESFLTNICHTPLDWQPANIITKATQMIQNTVGNGKVLMAVSGGVDSTVAAALLTKALGASQVTTVFINHGLLRQNEALEVKKIFAEMGIKNFHQLDCEDKFLSKLENINDPEEKRKIIGRTFIEEFEKFAKEKDTFTHLGQGTLYPDVIESAGHGSGSKIIKSHHNVGGLPKKLALKLIEPFRFFFKDEVRTLGKELGIHSEFLGRHPFPGPGLAVRILGTIKKDKIAILQKADTIFIEALRKHGLYNDVWQAFAVLLPLKTVGVMGDNRTYQWTCALRAVCAVDGMTATVSNLPFDFITGVADDIVRLVDGINRVVYDVTSKPPGTIEWE